MKKESRYSLQRTMIIYFLLISFASLFVGVEFIVDTHGSDLEEELIANFEKYADHQIERKAVFAPINKLRNKAILMIVIILGVMIIVLTMFIKNITEPLQHMIERSKKISKGDLSQTIEIRSNNELAELGNVINELSSNLQEIILLSKNLCRSSADFIQKANEIMANPEISRQDVEAIADELSILDNEVETISEVIEFFNFYTIGKS